MKKQELLEIMDQELLEKLFGFCYARTRNSQEARELCSDIMFELVKAARAEGDIENLYGFLWQVARNTYADFTDRKNRHITGVYQGNPEDVLPFLTSQEGGDDSKELLDAVYGQISFLTKAYREVMILFYLDGLSTAEIALRQNTSEVAIRQRLLAARKKIQSEVEEMAEINPKPVILDQIEFQIWGTGDPFWGDPSHVCTRQFSRHLVWLCRKKSVSATEAAEQLHVPTVYVEELEILRKGVNGQYGLLRRLDNGRSAMGKNAMGRYAINFILLDREEMGQVCGAYREQVPTVCRILSDYVKAHKEEYLAFPYLNRERDWNLILWQQVHMMWHTFRGCVERILREKYFAQVKRVERPFSVFGYEGASKDCGGGWDTVKAENICGYSRIQMENIYNKWIGRHFNVWHYVARDAQLQMALRALEGLSLDGLSEAEKEDAARAIECGYLYREGGMLYTKILVCSREDRDRLFDLTGRLAQGYLDECAEAVAEKMARLIRRIVPEHLLGEWEFANQLADMAVLDALIESLVGEGILTPPEDGLGAEGCWMSVEK